MIFLKDKDFKNYHSKKIPFIDVKAVYKINLTKKLTSAYIL